MHSKTRKSPLKFNQDITLAGVIASSYELKDYFDKNSKSKSDIMELAKELMFEAIKSRRNNRPKYSVEYIKQKRFLSPSQKKQITPKVTQTIPFSPQKHKIYAKPKMRTNQGWGCQTHLNDYCKQQIPMYVNQSVQTVPGIKNISFEKQYFTSQNQQDQQCKRNNENQQEKQFLRSRTKLPKFESRATNTINQNQYSNITTKENKSLQRKVNFAKNNEGTKQTKQNYRKIQSRIKELVEKDRKNKVMEEMERKQQQLMAKQYEKEKRIYVNETNHRNYRNARRQQSEKSQDVLSMSQFSSTSCVTSMDSQIIRRYDKHVIYGKNNENQLDNIPQCKMCQIENNSYKYPYQMKRLKINHNINNKNTICCSCKYPGEYIQDSYQHLEYIAQDCIQCQQTY